MDQILTFEQFTNIYLYVSTIRRGNRADLGEKKGAKLILES